MRTLKGIRKHHCESAYLITTHRFVSAPDKINEVEVIFVEDVVSDMPDVKTISMMHIVDVCYN